MPRDASPSQLQAAVKAGIAAAKQEPLACKSLAQFLGERMTVEFVVDDVLRREYVYTITAPTGAGKTAVAVLLALHIADGRPIGKHEVQGGVVVYVAGENPDDVRGRFAVACQEMKIRPESAPVRIVDRSFILAERADELQGIIEAVNACAVVVDTDQAVSLSCDSEENNNAERMAHAKRLRGLTRAKSRPVVLDLCHPRKNATKDDLTPRGGSAFLNEVDGNFCLWREADTAELFSDPNKFRGAPIAMNFAKRLVTSDAVIDTKGRPIPIPYYCLIDDDEAARQQNQEWKDENRLIWVMAGEPLASIAAWAKSCQWVTADGETPRKDKVHRLLKNLAKAKPPLVQQARSKHWGLTEHGKKEAQRQ
jgi:hypothetical protein